ncbi:MAG: AAA family ATPase, partial [Lachnospiraceae bacterium]|nr:AAA family ATPase [Lachnospiraceae bacterium]
MLTSLHVKNLALMEETEVEFGEGLNILTGETGAGKSLLIGSVNLALGGKFEREMLRKGIRTADDHHRSLSLRHLHGHVANGSG